MGLGAQGQPAIGGAADLPGGGEEVRVVVPVVSFPVGSVYRKIDGHPITLYQTLAKVAGQLRALTSGEF
jgi:hypothetical protein